VTTEPSELNPEVTDSGWLIFASLMLTIAGGFNVFKGLIAVTKPDFYGQHSVYAFSTISAWGWAILVLGVLEVVAAFAIFTGSQLARWFGVVAAALNAIGSLFFIHAYPVVTLTFVVIEGLVIYALALRWTPTETSSPLQAGSGA
jgi:hypothetical protein